MSASFISVCDAYIFILFYCSTCFSQRGETALITAAREGRVVEVKTLLLNGAAVNAMTPVSGFYPPFLTPPSVSDFVVTFICF